MSSIGDLEEELRAFKSHSTHSQVSFWRLSQTRLWFSVPNKDTLTGLQTCNLVMGRTLHVVWVINVSFNERDAECKVAELNLCGKVGWRVS